MKGYFREIARSIAALGSSMKLLKSNKQQQPVVKKYPEFRIKPPSRSRGRVHIDISRCTGCGECAAMCPVSCIKFKAAPDGRIKEFKIDFSQCFYCNICVEVCPEKCITGTSIYEMSEFKRNNLVYNFNNHKEN